MDEFQERYEKHLDRKKKDLSNKDKVKRLKQIKEGLGHLLYIMQHRHSQRTFNQEPITSGEMDYIEEAIRVAPSSCNRQAIYLVEANKFMLGEILVGGKNWLHNADRVYLVMGSREAYKNPVERSYMPYLDAGFVCENIYLMAEALDIGCCFVNPNIRDTDQYLFTEMYGEDYFCGAIALGNYDRKSPTPEKVRTIIK